jgi:hypothetical protein
MKRKTQLMMQANAQAATLLRALPNQQLKVLRETQSDLRQEVSIFKHLHGFAVTGRILDTPAQLRISSAVNRSPGR